MERILWELFGAIAPGIFNPASHAKVSFICGIAALFLYGNLMLNTDDVDTWPVALGWAVAWFGVSYLSICFAST